MKKLNLFCIFCLLAVPCLAQHQISFAWDLSVDDASLGAGGGYRLYQSKTSGVYHDPPVATTLAGISTVTIEAAAFGRHYWVVTAFMEDGTESEYSNEVSTVIKPKPPKLNSVQQIASTIKIGIDAIAGLFKKDGQLRIKK